MGGSGVRVHLVDGTYELFRHYYALPSIRSADGEEIAAVRGVLGSILSLLGDGATHVAVATDHRIESFRNELWPGYKDGSGIEPDLRAQFEPLEEALAAAGVVVWPMTEFEADDALAAGAAIARADDRVERVLICTPDKDLAQCVRGGRVVQLDRRRREIRDEAGVREKFGVGPESIPDWLALVGDSADGFPGIPGFGRVTAGALLARYGRLEEIPRDPAEWDAPVRGAERLAATLDERMEDALLFRRLATLVEEGPVESTVDELEWRAPTAELASTAARLGDPALAERAARLAERRA